MSTLLRKNYRDAFFLGRDPVDSREAEELAANGFPKVNYPSAGPVIDTTKARNYDLEVTN